MKKDKIFVQIASYRDPELIPTIQSALDNAEYPERLVFGICRQFHPDDKFDDLRAYEGHPHFKIINYDVSVNESLGACWARSNIQKLFSEEEYTLQLDSHHRFIKNWDSILINMLTLLQEDGYKKPIITAYAGTYKPKDDLNSRSIEPWQMDYREFSKEGIVHFVPSVISGWKELTKPIPARFVSGHFYFTIGQFCKEVQYDPDIYFYGEEISLSVRAYTSGYDLFHPHRIIIYHEYHREDKIRPWAVDKKWHEKDAKSFAHVRRLLNVDNERKKEDVFKYDLGSVRTVSDYEKYAGIVFRDRVVQKYTKDRKLPPSKIDRIFIHLPSYRDPELIPTIQSALDNAEYPERLVFGICRQFHPDDKFDDLRAYEGHPHFKIYNMSYKDAKGLPYARAIINEVLLEDEEYVLQLDSHHRFIKNWDSKLIKWHSDLERDGVEKPLLCGYLPSYTPFNEPNGRAVEPWITTANSFYEWGTIFIQPIGISNIYPNWKELTKPIPARFVSGHFCFGKNEWAKEIRHDPNIFFAGEELNLTIRSYTSGYDLFHLPEIVIWHSTMREERKDKLIWDDYKDKDLAWWERDSISRSRIRQLLGVDNGGHDLTGYGLGSVRTVSDYEKYAGIYFKDKIITPYAASHKPPPNPEENVVQNNVTMERSTYNISFNKDKFKLDDYDFWYISIDDKSSIAIWSSQIDKWQINLWLNGEEDIINHEVTAELKYYKNNPPYKWVIYAHSESNGWSEKIEKVL